MRQTASYRRAAPLIPASPHPSRFGAEPQITGGLGVRRVIHRRKWQKIVEDASFDSQMLPVQSRMPVTRSGTYSSYAELAYRGTVNMFTNIAD